MRGLNAVLCNMSHVAVLRTLHHASDPLTGREVERRSGLANRSTMLALESLVDMRAVHMEVSGRSYLYTLNRKHYLVTKGLNAAFKAEDMFWADVAKTVRAVVRPKPLAAVATGPLVRDETEYGGRITLTVLFATRKGRIKALRSLHTLADRIRDRHSLILEHHVLDVNTMDERQYIPLWRRVEREGILLFGTLP
jgi:DNA-binding transcriptional ArsR family regulator